MAKYISALDISTNHEDEEALKKKGFQQIPVDLNTGTGAENKVFLWYQRGSTPVTRVQVSFNEQMAVRLKELNYTKIKKSLNTGTKGKEIYMWYSHDEGSHDIPLLNVNVSTDANSEASHLTAGGQWEEVSCNLNLGNDGNIVYVWLQRESPFYISEVTATDSYDQDADLLSKGFTRVDVDTNMGAVGGAEVFIWYGKTDDAAKSLGVLNISASATDEGQLKKGGFEQALVNLNENTPGPAVYLWHKGDPMKKVRNLVLLQDKEAVQKYKDRGITVIEKSLNTGNQGADLYLCFYA